MKKLFALLILMFFSLSAMDAPEQILYLQKNFDLNEPFNKLHSDVKNCIASYATADGWWYPDTKLKYEHRPVMAYRYAERVRFSPSGKKIVTSPSRGKGCSVIGLSANDIWDEHGNLVYTFFNPWECGLAKDWFDDTENKFFVSSGWADIKVYDFNEKELRAVRTDQVREGWGGLEKLAWTPDCNKIACLANYQLCEIDIASKSETIIPVEKFDHVCLMNFCKNETGYIFDYKICPQQGRYITRNNLLFCFYASKENSFSFCTVYDSNCIGLKRIIIKQNGVLKGSEDFPKVSTTGAKIAFKSSYFVPENSAGSEVLNFKEGCILYDVASETSQQLPIESCPSTIQFNHNDTLMFLCMDHCIQVWDIREKPILQATIACGYKNPRVVCDKQGEKFIVSENDIYVWSKYKPTFKQRQLKLLLNAWWKTARTARDFNSPEEWLADVAKRFSLSRWDLILPWKSLAPESCRLEVVKMPNGNKKLFSILQAAMWATVQSRIKRSQQYKDYVPSQIS